MRVRLTLPDAGENNTEVYPSVKAARARIAELQERAPWLGQLQVEMGPAGKPQTRKEVLHRYPCLIGHIICDSLGYFTPQSAAGALLAYIEGQSFACEWYCHMAGGYNHDKLLQVGKQVVERAFRSRRHHRGYMAHYPQAKALVQHVRGGGEGPVFASWF
jgi:hypothetical protein